MKDFDLTKKQLEAIDKHKDFNKYDTFIILFEPKKNMFSIKLGYGNKSNNNADWGRKTYVSIENFVATTEKLTLFTAEYHRHQIASLEEDMFAETEQEQIDKNIDEHNAKYDRTPLIDSAIDIGSQL